MEYCKPVCTPMVTSCNFSSQGDSPLVNQPEYKSMIRSLLYLKGTWWDIVHVVAIGGRFQENPKEIDLHADKRIFKYFQGTKDYGLWYPKNAYFYLLAHTYVDWVGNVDDQKSTSGGEFYLGSYLVSWFNKKKKLHCFIYCWSRICCWCILLYSTSIDDANIIRYTNNLSSTYTYFLW